MTTARLADPIVFGPAYIPREPYAPYARFADGSGGYWASDVLRCRDCNRRIRTGEPMGLIMPPRCADCCDALERRGEH
jgi:hypothetical protein